MPAYSLKANRLYVIPFSLIHSRILTFRRNIWCVKTLSMCWLQKQQHLSFLFPLLLLIVQRIIGHFLSHAASYESITSTTLWCLQQRNVHGIEMQFLLCDVTFKFTRCNDADSLISYLTVSLIVGKVLVGYVFELIAISNISCLPRQKETAETSRSL